MKEGRKPRLVGVNHLVLEVADIDDALSFYGAIFDFELRGRGKGHAFIDMGDQFLGLTTGMSSVPDQSRHFGLVVDDAASVRDLAEKAGAEILDTPFLDFRDPWGNRVQVVEYRDLQFTKADAVLRAMGLDLEKSAEAQTELRKKDMAG